MNEEEKGFSDAQLGVWVIVSGTFSGHMLIQSLGHGSWKAN